MATNKSPGSPWLPKMPTPWRKSQAENEEDYANASTADTLPVFADLHSDASTSDGGTDSDEPGVVAVEEDLQRMSLERAILAPHQVRPWDPSGYMHVKKLQEAACNDGVVDLMRNKGSFVAVKRMPNRWVLSGHQEFVGHRPKALERPWYDLGVLRLLNTKHFRYVVQLYGIFRDEHFTYVVTEFATGGDLFDWSRKGDIIGPGRERDMKPIVAQICTAVRMLHDLGVAHRDISLENILLHNDNESFSPVVKLIDFGMATTSRYCTSQCGKATYQAPEMHTGCVYDAFAADNFAVGVALFGMAVQDFPWRSTRQGKCVAFEYISKHGLERFAEVKKVRGHPGKHVKDVLSPKLLDLLVALLKFKPKRRANMGEDLYCKAESVWDQGWFVGESI